MTRRLITLMISACLAGLPGAGPSMADEVEDNGAQKCIRARQLKSNVVLDDSNILFFMVGNSVYHNTLPKQCKGLFKYKTFIFERTAGRLCEFDQIEVHGFTTTVGRTCRLGKFRPIKPNEIRPLIEKLHAGPTPKPLDPAEVEDVTEEADPKEETGAR